MAMKSDLYAGLTNAYRTRHYIVFQKIGLCDDEEMGTFPVQRRRVLPAHEAARRGLRAQVP